jgi:CheY-like chemotaxis protein
VSGDASGPGGHLLIAEDEPVCQRNVVAILSGAGYSIDAVSDGAAAVAANGASRYDAIIMDCRMPVMNGYRATTRIRSQEGYRRHTPIIGLATGSRPEDRERCLAFGMDAYLAKPVGIDALLALVDSFVDPWSRRSGDARDRPALVVVAPDDGDPSSDPSQPTSGPDGRIVPLPVDSTGDPDGAARLPSLDHTIIDELDLLDGGAGLVDELAELFLGDAEAQLDILNDAVAAHDSDTIGRVAHRLVGSAANLGLSEFVRLCSLLSAHAGVQDDAALSSVLAALRSELGRVRAAFEQRAADR